MKYKFSAQQVSDYLKPELLISKSEVYRYAKKFEFKFPLNLDQAIRIRKLKMKKRSKSMQTKVIYFSGYRQCPDKANIILQMLPLDEIKYDKILIIDSTSYMHLSDKIFCKHGIENWEVEKIKKINPRVDFLCDRFFYLNETELIERLKNYQDKYNKIIVCIDEMTNVPFISNDHFMIYNQNNIKPQLKKRRLNFKTKAKILEISLSANKTTQSINSNGHEGVYKTRLELRKDINLNLSLLEQKSLGIHTLSLIKDCIYKTDKDLINNMLSNFLEHEHISSRKTLINYINESLKL